MNLPEFSEIPARIQRCGVAGAGGAGFPTYAKWRELTKIDKLLVNLQEGEPVFYGDKWLVSERANFYAEGLQLLSEELFPTLVVATKKKYRQRWFAEFERALNGSVYLPDKLPVERLEGAGSLLIYTGERYELSQETALLWTVAGQQIGTDLPTEHGWIVNNAETVYNVLKALLDRRPVTRKQVLLYGTEFGGEFFIAPVGTSVFDLLDAAEINDLAVSEPVFLDGGPGWACEMDKSPQNCVISKRTNGVLVADRALVEKYRDSDEPERINALACCDWSPPAGYPQPRELEPEKVRIPLLTNPALAGPVEASEPAVSTGERVKKGQVIARPASAEGFSNYQHASITGTVREINSASIVIER